MSGVYREPSSNAGLYYNNYSRGNEVTEEMDVTKDIKIQLVSLLHFVIMHKWDGIRDAVKLDFHDTVQHVKCNKPHLLHLMSHMYISRRMVVSHTVK